jgi:hypothetical protein
MTEAEWLQSSDPVAMLNWLGGYAPLAPDRLSARKKRLFAVACCRRIWHLLTDIRSRAAVEVAERYADGTASPEELHLAHEAAFIGYQNAFAIHDSAASAAVGAASGGARDAAYTASRCAQKARGVESRGQADLLRDLVGNPFRPVAFDPDWLRWNGGIIATLVDSIYEARLSQEMLLLGDALEDAGCTDPQVLDHCRAGGPHPRGCWLLDLLLGKEQQRS